MMNKLAQLLVTLVIAFVSTTVFSSEINSCDINTMMQTIQHQPHLQKFKQEKNIKVLANPLTSFGYLLLANQEAVVWQTTQPIKSTTVISPNNFRQYNKKDQLMTMPANTSNQTSQLVSSTFLSILSGTIDQLNDNFEVSTSCSETEWHISLIPNNNDILRLLQKIDITGNIQINQLNFVETNQDITQISFTPTDDSTIKNQLRSYLAN
ncbi:outer membrane lipoprotein carrier protein LolA [Kangiella geojedonensis]|uniref:Outer membrane lipoprotein carrier protein LolA n=1 Tax=Kangiella geojedonensis TaxID=914150 RepID=A0A0F6RDP7_9GAMM|nr:outer membrane lipoprotein carrier protein LolA [Kangiella geojedonensis]AKE53146.1 hypothetical protein TQ33_2222 [Kangiella geojedonensis]